MPTRHTSPAHRYGVKCPYFPGAPMIRVHCPECHVARAYPDRLAGLESPCPHCGTAVTVGGPHAEYEADTTIPEPRSPAQPACNGAIRTA